MKYRLVIPANLEEVIRVLPPSLKSPIRAGLSAIQSDPHQGKPLTNELRGFWSFRVNRYRIIYRIHLNLVEVEIVDIGPREVIYSRMLEWSKAQKRLP